jgi:ATP-dependent DNA helicase DinG
VVAFLDSRMMSARYAGFLQRSLPPFWPTSDRNLVLNALKRLDATAPPPLEVADPALRGLTGAVQGTSMGDAEVKGEVDATDTRPVATAPPVAPSARTAVTQGHAWTDEEDEELRDGVELGLDVEELSESLELPADVIAARLEGLGLEAGKGSTLSFD